MPLFTTVDVSGGSALVDIGRAPTAGRAWSAFDVALAAAVTASLTVLLWGDGAFSTWIGVAVIGAALLVRTQTPAASLVGVALAPLAFDDPPVAAVSLCAIVLVASIMTLAAEGRVLLTIGGLVFYVSILALAAADVGSATDEGLDPGVAALFAAQGVVLVVAMLSLSADVTAGHDKERRAMLAAADAELRMRRAHELERQQIALELHAIVADAMHRVRASTAAQSHADDLDESELVDALTAAEDASRGALAELRRMVRVLRAVDPDADLAMRPQPGATEVAELLRAAAPSAAVDVGDAGAAELDQTVSMAVFRLVEDALELLRVDGTSTLSVATVRRDGDEIEVVLEGGDVGAAEMRLGYPHTVAMRDRVQVVGGSVLIASGEAGTGVRVVARFPLRRG